MTLDITWNNGTFQCIWLCPVS